MTKKNLFAIIATALVLVFSTMILTGCSQTPDAPATGAVAQGGVINLKVNPEIAVAYDDNGLVTKLTAKNDDAKKILEGYADYEGKECRTVISELVTKIGEAGYLVEEIEGENRQITIEIEGGSKLPSNTFLDDIVSDVKLSVGTNKWQAPIDVKGESDYGITDYVDTDYGTGNDGVTDYTDYGTSSGQTATKPAGNAGATDYNDTDYGVNSDGVTDYDDTDYGPNNDGVTDYDDTDYGPNNDGVTDYDDTDYGPNNDGVTDYDDTDYGPNNDGVTDYDDTDYGPDNDGVTDYDDTDYSPNNDGVTDYDDGNSNYDDGNSNYGNSDYD